VNVYLLDPDPGHLFNIYWISVTKDNLKFYF